MTEFPQPDAWLEHRVSYGETDAMGVLYYANYFHLFERSRNQYIRVHGVSYAKVEEQGLFLPVRDADCRYRKPARYDDLLQIHVGVSKWGHASMTFVYEIFNETKNMLHATGSTTHALVNRQGRPQPVPDWFRNMFA